LLGEQLKCHFDSKVVFFFFFEILLLKHGALTIPPEKMAAMSAMNHSGELKPQMPTPRCRSSPRLRNALAAFTMSFRYSVYVQDLRTPSRLTVMAVWLPPD
jgi:hypothetical protein